MKTQSKTSYVLKQGDKPAKAVVKQAKADGIKISVAQVYNIRSQHKRKNPDARAVMASVGSAPKGFDSQVLTAEKNLRVAALTVGTIRARQILDTLEAM